MGRANVDIEQATHEDLKKGKEQQGLKKLGDVVRVLTDHYLATTLVEVMRLKARRTRMKMLASR
jgi:hypothetical protein